ncbi:uncharacterized protein LOC120762437 [Hirundo rustica]|uniref:uncharacterized protein LOC120762437 n=1 Tax=Hirundo rustica TaxID=43150 RepID=UPI001A942C9A|nr:uncharacterized protein LOC120762437 [Hirundo rustica]
MAAGAARGDRRVLDEEKEKSSCESLWELRIPKKGVILTQRWNLAGALGQEQETDREPLDGRLGPWGPAPERGRTEGRTPDTGRTPPRHTENRQQTREGAVGSILALKKGKWSKSAQLGGGHGVVLALAEGVFRAPPRVDLESLKRFAVPNPLVVSHSGCCGFPAQNSRAWELGHPPAFPHQGSNSIVSPVFFVKMSEYTEYKAQYLHGDGNQGRSHTISSSLSWG